MKNTTERQHQRHSLAIPATLKGNKVTIVSISSGGCAIRTATHLQNGEKLVLDLPFVAGGQVRIVHVPAEVVWLRDDYRIDTFYRCGLKFIEPLSEDCVLEVVAEEDLSVSQIQNKVVA